MQEVVLGTGHTFAEKLAQVRVEAEIAMWALSYGDDWQKAWAECPRADWLVEMAMLGGDVKQESDEHRSIVRMLRDEVRDLRQSFVLAAEEVLLYDLAGAWLEGRIPAEVMKQAVQQRQWIAAGIQMEMLSGGIDQKSAARCAVYLVAGSAYEPTAPSFCARAISFARVGTPRDARLAQRVAEALPCPARLRVERLLS